MEESVSKRGTDRFSELPNSDRFSELPNSLIHLILSLLPIRDVVSTTLLSKRWKNLWNTVPCLNFCDLTRVEVNDKNEEEETEKVLRFVNRVLILWRGTGLLKFKLDTEWFDSPWGYDIDSWLCFAVENGVKELDIRLRCEKFDLEMESEDSKELIYWAPLCLDSCSSIIELSLVGCNLEIPVKPSWNQLKRLKIDGYCYSERVIKRILLGSPRLEVFELRLVESNENLIIRSTSLKKLKIEKFLMFAHDKPSKDKVLKISCPNLEMLAISGVLYSKCWFTNFPSLTDVTLGFKGTCDYPCGNERLEETLKQIFSTFQHVDKVTLSYWCVQVLGVLQNKYLLSSFFPNLKMLVIKDPTKYGLDEFDASEILEFERWHFDTEKYLEFETKLSKSFVLQLKTVDITTYLWRTSTLRFIEFLLKDACMLEKLVIRISENYSMRWFKEAQGLLYMPRSSPTAKVILKNIDHQGTDDSIVTFC